MNVVFQQYVERACEIIKKSFNFPERKTLSCKVQTVTHADAKENGINLREKYEGNWLELTALHVVEDASLFTALLRE